MKLTKDTKFLIIGLGVMGGSYARALTDAGYHVECITKEQADVDYALSHRMIACGTTEADPAVIARADLVVFALYPTVLIDWVKQYGHLFHAGALLTDVSGVKCGVIEKVQALLSTDVEFISSHPMAGRESSGVLFSDPRVFQGANYLVVPTEKNTPQAIETCEELGRILGFARICRVDAAFHDRMIAFLSQLTHCIAVCLMNCNTEPHMEKYTGDSFRDLTRIAKINDRMWSELFLLNKDALLEQMDGFEREFHAFRDLIARGETEKIRERMRAGTARRVLFDKPDPTCTKTAPSDHTPLKEGVACPANVR